MSKIKQISIIGLGLMGASLALRIKEKYPDILIKGHDSLPETEDRALQANIIQEKGLPDHSTDLVIVCVPQQKVITVINDCLSKVAKTCIVTDIASTKSHIKQAISSEENVILGHPIAGKTDSGLGAAEATLFDHCHYILCPSPSKLYPKLKAFIEGLNVTVIEMSAEDHDHYIAMTSHIPYLMAGLTAEQCDDAANSVKGPGFQSTTRVAASDPNWGLDCIQLNRQNILSQLDDVQESLRQLITLIKEEKDSDLLKKLHLFQNNKQRTFNIKAPQIKQIYQKNNNDKT